MKSILSIQSHVTYGYVGNKAAVYPLQTIGFDVWPINTVQFSNHTGYGKWQGEIFSKEHIISLVDGIFDIGQAHKCTAILSGYMGSRAICEAVKEIVLKFKAINHNLIYLCDPVIGNNSCYVKPEVLDFFKNELSADIITPNQYEAEVLSGININTRQDLIAVAHYFHKLKIKIVVITGVKLGDDVNLDIFASDGQQSYIVTSPEYHFNIPISGTGDLFSSTFLGAYLQYNDIGLALQYATFYLQSAIEKTIEAGERELQVLAVEYKNVEQRLLPKIINM
ncbi:MAG: pyridoxal kinase [Gammaproteobacteria bacterium]|nr:pyridoxal kinase [Gammaproteobacteria bacterium]